MSEITIETVGRRHYLVGNTYPLRSQIREAGCKWDPARKAWYSGKRLTIDNLMAALGSGNDTPSDTTNEAPSSQGREAPGEDATVAARATYKGRTYYVLGRVCRGRTHYDDTVSEVTTRDGSKVLLAFRDGSKSFWALRSLVQITKRYDRPQSIRGLKKFADRAKEARAQGYDDGIAEGQRYECEECGEYVIRGGGSACWETGCAH